MQTHWQDRGSKRGPGKTAARARPVALVIEDDPETRQVEADLLGEAGYQVVVSSTGEDGLQAARTHRPDVVLLDLALPRMSGFDVLRTLKGAPETEPIPVVIVTAYTEQVPGCVALGAARCVPKPFSVEGLLSNVAQVAPTPS